LKKKVTYIISNIDKALSFEWIAEEINTTKIELNFILLNNGNSILEDHLRKLKFIVYRINYSSKKNIPISIIKIINFLLKNKTDVVHTHLFDASLVGLIAAKLAGVKKRIYTRHYSTYHHKYFPKAVKWDKFINGLATDIIAISNNVFSVLVNNEGVAPKKITIINHGFKLSNFEIINEPIVTRLKARYNPHNRTPVIGVISRFTELKGIQFIIPAFKKVLIKYPDALLLLFNAEGDHKNEINKLLTELPPNSYKTTNFENEITSIYHIFDVFIHVPINDSIEAFGQTYIEAMASKTPLIATRSGIANEILTDKQNSIIVPHKNSEAIYEAIELVLSSPELKNNLTSNALITAKSFELNNMIKKLETLYLQ
jgi:glycosyltransferase involved in cell wall biosynthesis